MSGDTNKKRRFRDVYNRNKQTPYEPKEMDEYVQILNKKSSSETKGTNICKSSANDTLSSGSPKVTSDDIMSGATNKKKRFRDVYNRKKQTPYEPKVIDEYVQILNKKSSSETKGTNICKSSANDTLSSGSPKVTSDDIMSGATNKKKRFRDVYNRKKQTPYEPKVIDEYVQILNKKSSSETKGTNICKSSANDTLSSGSPKVTSDDIMSGATNKKKRFRDVYNRKKQTPYEPKVIDEYVQILNKKSSSETKGTNICKSSANDTLSSGSPKVTSDDIMSGATNKKKRFRDVYNRKKQTPYEPKVIDEYVQILNKKSSSETKGTNICKSSANDTLSSGSPKVASDDIMSGATNKKKRFRDVYNRKKQTPYEPKVIDEYVQILNKKSSSETKGTNICKSSANDTLSSGSPKVTSDDIMSGATNKRKRFRDVYNRNKQTPYEPKVIDEYVQILNKKSSSETKGTNICNSSASDTLSSGSPKVTSDDMSGPRNKKKRFRDVYNRNKQTPYEPKVIDEYVQILNKKSNSETKGTNICNSSTNDTLSSGSTDLHCDNFSGERKKKKPFRIVYNKSKQTPHKTKFVDEHVQTCVRISNKKSSTEVKSTNSIVSSATVIRTPKSLDSVSVGRPSEEINTSGVCALSDSHSVRNEKPDDFDKLTICNQELLGDFSGIACRSLFANNKTTILPTTRSHTDKNRQLKRAKSDTAVSVPVLYNRYINENHIPPQDNCNQNKDQKCNQDSCNQKKGQPALSTGNMCKMATQKPATVQSTDKNKGISNIESFGKQLSESAGFKQGSYNLLKGKQIVRPITRNRIATKPCTAPKLLDSSQIFPCGDDVHHNSLDKNNQLNEQIGQTISKVQKMQPMDIEESDGDSISSYGQFVSRTDKFESTALSVCNNLLESASKIIDEVNLATEVQPRVEHIMPNIIVIENNSISTDGGNVHTEISNNRKIKIGEMLKQIKEESVIHHKISMKQIEDDLKAEEEKKLNDRIVYSPVRKTVKKKLTKRSNDVYVKGKIYKVKKPPKLQPWVTTRLYDFLKRQLKSKYKDMAQTKSERLVLYLVNKVTAVTKEKKPEIWLQLVDDLKRKMASKGIVVTHQDFNHFANEHLPYKFIERSVPSITRAHVPYVPGMAFEPILNAPME